MSCNPKARREKINIIDSKIQNFLYGIQNATKANQKKLLEAKSKVNL